MGGLVPGLTLKSYWALRVCISSATLKQRWEWSQSWYSCLCRPFWAYRVTHSHPWFAKKIFGDLPLEILPISKVHLYNTSLCAPQKLSDCMFTCMGEHRFCAQLVATGERQDSFDVTLSVGFKIRPDFKCVFEAILLTQNKKEPLRRCYLFCPSG